MPDGQHQLPQYLWRLHAWDMHMTVHIHRFHTRVIQRSPSPVLTCEWLRGRRHSHASCFPG